MGVFPMKYLVAGMFAVALLASPSAMAACYHHCGWGLGHHYHSGWWGDPHWAHHHWAHGERLFFNWRDAEFVDWRWHHLHDPGRFHWVFAGGDTYLLVDDGGVVMETYP